LVAVAGVALLLSASAAAMLPGLSVGRSDAELRIESEPGGAEVRIDGERRGTTPLVIHLAPGTYDLGLTQGNFVQQRQITLAREERASIYHLLSQAPAAPTNVLPVSAGLSVITEPPGGAVNIDGTDRGVTPLVIDNLAPGEHRLVVRNRGAIYRQAVTLHAGSTATVVVGANAGLAAGWLTVQSPLALQIHEGGALLGITQTNRLMLTAGDHQLTFSNQQAGFQVTRSVRIVEGDTTAVVIQVPRAPASVNAIPWAEVWVNSERVGETPIGNYSLPLGDHQVELRHPQLGTKRVTMSVSLNGSNRLSVNMRQP
jgi:hypothetical protein